MTNQHPQDTLPDEAHGDNLNASRRSRAPQNAYNAAPMPPAARRLARSNTSDITQNAGKSPRIASQCRIRVQSFPASPLRIQNRRRASLPVRGFVTSQHLRGDTPTNAIQTADINAGERFQPNAALCTIVIALHPVARPQCSRIHPRAAIVGGATADSPQ